MSMQSGASDNGQVQALGWLQSFVYVSLTYDSLLFSGVEVFSNWNFWCFCHVICMLIQEQPAEVPMQVFTAFGRDKAISS